MGVSAGVRKERVVIPRKRVLGIQVFSTEKKGKERKERTP
jgi:hypothetical protein